MFVACTNDPRAPAVLVDTRLHAAPSAPILAEPPKALGTCDDALADAKAKRDMGWKDEGDALDADGDGTPECVLRGCYGADCAVVIYTREPGRVRRIAEMKASFLSHPRCVDPAKDRPRGFCRLIVGIHMIHGETQELLWAYAGDRYVENGHGKLYPGPKLPRHP